MIKNKLIKTGFLNALAVTAYVFLVASFLSNVQSLLRPMGGPIGTTLFLLLLVLSVAVVGSFIFVKPAMIFHAGQKKEGVELLGFTLSFLFLAVIFAILVIAFWG